MSIRTGGKHEEGSLVLNNNQVKTAQRMTCSRRFTLTISKQPGQCRRFFLLLAELSHPSSRLTYSRSERND
ncbi:unnamed protein product [Calypogeia fissa]